MIITMGRKLVIGDIHGGLRALHQIMERANVTKDDRLIFLGDYVDGWSESPQVIDYLIDLSTQQECLFIRGNHDELLLDWLTGNTDNIDESAWYQHGGETTVLSYAAVPEDKKQVHITFLKSLKEYYLDEQNRLFIHAGFTNMNGIDYEYFPKMFYWDRTLWETALALDDSMTKNNIYYPKRLTLYKEVYIGHTPVTKINETIPIQRACVWNIDTGAAFNGPLTIMDIDSKEFWQSEPVKELYLNERGRN